MHSGHENDSDNDVREKQCVLPVTQCSHPFGHVDLLGFVTDDKGVLEQLAGIRSFGTAPYQTVTISFCNCTTSRVELPFGHKVFDALGPYATDFWVILHCRNWSSDDIG